MNDEKNIGLDKQQRAIASRAWRRSQRLHLTSLNTKKDANIDHETYINKAQQIINVCGMTFVIPGAKK